MSRESQIAAILRADATLMALLPGRVWEHGKLGVEGLTDPVTTPAAYSGGKLQPAALVRQRAKVPTGDLQSIASQRTSTSQAVEVWVYSSASATIEAVLNRIYVLLMGKRLAAAFSATWIGGGPGVMPAPEMASGIKTNHEDYRIVFIRRAVTV
jgi:hypothetical protein